MFQFLIGWLQTIHLQRKRKSFIKFQFLIGWLQTTVKPNEVAANTVVSIPYRLATNKTGGLGRSSHPNVSIPYRLATNCKFHGYSIKRFDVSIPYRLATN